MGPMSSELLTVNEIKHWLHLNRVTIYRLIRENNLPAAKVGGQWRFQRAAVEDWLNGQAFLDPPALARKEDDTLSITDLLSVDELQPLLEQFAAAAGMSVFLVDMDGSPIMECRNCSPFCQLAQSTHNGETACMASRTRPAPEGHELSYFTCHAGLNYLETPVEIEGNRIALAIVGPFIADETQREAIRQALPGIAQHIGVEPGLLLEQMHTIASFSDDKVAPLAELLAHVVSAISQVAYNRRS